MDEPVRIFNDASWVYRRAVSRGENVFIPTWGLGDVVTTLVGAAVVSLLATLGFMASHIDPVNGWGLIATASFPWIVLAGWPLLTAARKGNGAQLDLGLSAKQSHIRFGVLAGLGGLGIAFVAATVTQHFTGPIDSTAGLVSNRQHGLVLFVFALCTLFIAPVAEEIAFRGLLYTALAKSGLHEIACVVISAGIFAMFHFEPQRFLILFAIGCVLGEVRRRTGTTSASIATHMINNLPAALGMLYSIVQPILPFVNG